MIPVPYLGIFLLEGKQYIYGDILDATCATPVMAEASLVDMAGLAVMVTFFMFPCGIPS